MTEAEFSDLIDARFPYGKSGEALKLVELACSISPNAAFMVAEELARPPRSARVSRHRREILLGELERRFDHPLKERIFTIARRLIGGCELAVPEALEAVRAIASYPGQYAALNIAYFSADDVAGDVDQAKQQVVGRWSRGA